MPKTVFEQLKKLAHEKHGEYIYPTVKKNRLCQCVTVEQNVAILWYNTPDHSTHVVMIELK